MKTLNKIVIAGACFGLSACICPGLQLSEINENVAFSEGESGTPVYPEYDQEPSLGDYTPGDYDIPEPPVEEGE